MEEFRSSGNGAEVLALRPTPADADLPESGDGSVPPLRSGHGAGSLRVNLGRVVVGTLGSASAAGAGDSISPVAGAGAIAAPGSSGSEAGTPTPADETAKVADSPVRPPANLVSGSLPWCLWVNRDKDYWQANPVILARKHFGAHTVQIDTGTDEPLDGRVLAVEYNTDTWDADQSFSVKVILARGRVITLPYEFVMAGHVWVMDHNPACGCDVE